MSTQHRRCRSITSLLNARQAAANHGGLVGGMTVLSIMVTAYQVRWQAVEDRIKSHPLEAKQLDEHGRTVLFKALSRRMDDYPTYQTLQSLVEANRAAVWEGIVDLYTTIAADGTTRARNHRPRDDSALMSSPLIVAAWRRASLETIQCLVSARPSVPAHDVAALVALWNSYREVYRSEPELLSLLFEGGRESFAIFSKLHCILHYCTAPGQKLEASWLNGGSLHQAALAPHCSLELFQVILQKFPEQIRQQDEQGRLPLHSLVAVVSSSKQRNCKNHDQQQHSRWERMKILLEIHPQATMRRDLHGKLPIHLALEAGWEYPFLSELVEAFPQSLSERDGSHRLYPFQLAAIIGSSLTTIFKLLQAAPNLVVTKVPSQPIEQDSTINRYEKQSAANTSTAIDTAPAISDELKALLQYVRAKNDDKLWLELQQLLRSQPADEWFALHAAVTLSECTIGFLRVLIHMHPEQLQRQDRRLGRMPLHYAAANSKKSLLATTPVDDDDDDDDDNTSEVDLRTLRLQVILDSHPAAARMVDCAGQLPLHIAAYEGMPSACLELLIQASPDGLCQRDGRHCLYPFLLAACSPVTALNEVFLLLLRAPHVLAACGLVD